MVMAAVGEAGEKRRERGEGGGVTQVEGVGGRVRGSGGGEEAGREAAEPVTIVVRLHHSSGPPMAVYLWIIRAHIDYQRGCGMDGGGWGGVEGRGGGS